MWTCICVDYEKKVRITQKSPSWNTSHSFACDHTPDVVLSTKRDARSGVEGAVPLDVRCQREREREREQRQRQRQRQRCRTHKKTQKWKRKKHKTENIKQVAPNRRSFITFTLRRQHIHTYLHPHTHTQATPTHTHIHIYTPKNYFQANFRLLLKFVSCQHQASQHVHSGK